MYLMLIAELSDPRQMVPFPAWTVFEDIQGCFNNAYRALSLLLVAEVKEEYAAEA